MEEIDSTRFWKLLSKESIEKHSYRHKNLLSHVKESMIELYRIRLGLDPKHHNKRLQFEKEEENSEQCSIFKTLSFRSPTKNFLLATKRQYMQMQIL